MNCRQMDMICNIFSELSPKQSIIAIDIIRILYNKRKHGMDLVEINRYFRNRYIHSVKNTLEWLKDKGYITILIGNEVGIKYVITKAGIKKHLEICSNLEHIIGLAFPRLRVL